MRGAHIARLLLPRAGGIIPADAGSTVGAPPGPPPPPAGIIPADAGSTGYGYDWIDKDLDHPRGCGEHSGFNILDSLDEGSSPRMRGALDPSGERVHMVGIIPADAGSTKT